MKNLTKVWGDGLEVRPLPGDLEDPGSISQCPRKLDGQMAQASGVRLQWLETLVR